MATRARSTLQSKSTPRKASKAPGGKATWKPVLTPTDTPGVYRNGLGVLVNEHGVMLGLMEAKQFEEEDLAAVVGHAVATPAQYLKAVALDPRVPLPVRLDAAKAAAPYTDRKQPIAVDGGVDPQGNAKPIQLEMSDEGLAALSKEEREVLKKALAAMRPKP